MQVACLIIGDEILNGKILDLNLHQLARFVFATYGVPLRQTLVCSDDPADISASLRFLQQNADIVVTSGGIGSTHDDVTYEAVAAAYGLQVALDSEVVSRMWLRNRTFLEQLTPEQRDSFFKMATLPQSGTVPVSKTFVDDLWVPIVGVNNEVYILPGVPEIFKQLAFKLKDVLHGPVATVQRRYVSTTMSESSIAPFLTKVQGQTAAKIGSYPHLGWNLVTVSIIGEDIDAVVQQVAAGIKGKEISSEEEDYILTHDPPKSKH